MMLKRPSESRLLSSIVIQEAMSQKLGLLLVVAALAIVFFYSCLDVAGIAIIVLNYYDSLTNRRYNTREIDEQEWRS